MKQPLATTLIPLSATTPVFARARSCGILLLGLVLLCAFDAARSENSNSKRVLFLGNSVFYSRGGLCPTFEGFCREAGLKHEAVSQWNKPANTMGIEFLNHGRIPLNLPAVAEDEKIHQLIRDGGFEQVKYRNLTLGIAALHSGWKL